MTIQQQQVNPMEYLRQVCEDFASLQKPSVAGPVLNECMTAWNMVNENLKRLDKYDADAQAQVAADNATAGRVPTDTVDAATGV